MALWNKGKHLSEETRKKISEGCKGHRGAWTGKKLSMETRKKMSESRKGKKFSKETREKMSLARKGRVFSEEWRKKLCEAARNRKIIKTSKGEKELANFIKGVYSGPIKENYKKLFPDKGYELDVYLPEIGLAFEYNGDYYHKDPKVIAKDFWKQEHAKDLGVQIYFIWESDWKSRRKECEDFIKEVL